MRLQKKGSIGTTGSDKAGVDENPKKFSCGE
jgi:hypothetical protein